MSLKEKKYFIFYLIFLFICGVIFLFNKYNVQNNWTISEWLINFEGGFTRRGFLGQIAFEVAKFFNIQIRSAILLIQTISYLIFIILIYNFLKNTKINFLSRLSIYVSIFLLYPVAEVESLVRKETIIFILFIIFLLFASKKFNKNYCNIYVFFIFPVAFFIYEPVIFFLPYIWFILFQINKKKNILKTFLKTFLLISPSIFSFIFIISNPISNAGHEKMCLSLMTNFKEECGMALNLLISKSGVLQQFQANIEFYKISYILRYAIIILIGFMPLFILSANSKFKNKNLIFNFKSFLPIILILLFLSLIFLTAMQDWGRAINIIYTFSILTYFFLINNNYLILDKGRFYSMLEKIFDNNKYYYVLFFFYCFSWNMKTLMSEKIGSFPIYRIVTKIIKILIN